MKEGTNIPESEIPMLELEEGDITLIEEDDLESLGFEIISGHSNNIDKDLIQKPEELYEVGKRAAEIVKTIEKIEAMFGDEREGLSFQLASHAAVEVDLLRLRLSAGLRQISQRLRRSEALLGKIQKPSAHEIKRSQEDKENLEAVETRWHLESIVNAVGERIGTRATPKSNPAPLVIQERHGDNLINFPEIRSESINKRAVGEN